MKNKKIIFVCALFVAMLAFGLSKVKIKAGGAVAGGGTNYYYAPNYLRFNAGVFSASMEFITPFEKVNGNYEVGIYEETNLITTFSDNVPIVINSRDYIFNSFEFNVNDTLFLYNANEYSLDDVSSIDLYYDNITISGAIIDYLPIFENFYDLELTMNYYTFNTDNELVINDYDKIIYGYNNWFEYIINDLNLSEIYISELQVTILNPNLRDTFKLIMYPIGEYQNNGFLHTDKELAERLDYKYYPMLTWLTDSIGAFLNTPIFGGNISIGGILLIIVSISLVIALLKFFAGG